MRDHNNQFVFGNFLQKFHDLHAGLGIQSAGRLIRKDDIGVVDQSASDGDALHLTAGKLVWQFVKLIRKPNFEKGFLGKHTTIGPFDAGKGQSQFHVAEYGLVRNQIVGLKDKADGVIAIVVPIAILIFLGGNAVDQKITAGVVIQAADDVQKRRFTATGMTEDGNEFALAERNADAL